MFWFCVFLLSLTFLSIFYTVDGRDDLSESNKYIHWCNNLLVANLIPTWIAIIAFGFVDHFIVFIIAIIWGIIMAIASIMTFFQNHLYGLGNLICYGSYLVLLIFFCNNYENPNLSPSIDYNGRYCQVDKDAYCSPIKGNDDFFTLFEYENTKASFRNVCGICHRRFSVHWHEKYTESEWTEKLRQDSIFEEQTLDYMPYIP